MDGIPSVPGAINSTGNECELPLDNKILDICYCGLRSYSYAEGRIPGNNNRQHSEVYPFQYHT